MADYKEAYKKMIIELTEAIDELTRVRNNAIKFVIKTKSEENKKRKPGLFMEIVLLEKLTDPAKQEAILQAEGEAQARIRVAEAEAKAIELISEAVGKSTNPANYLLAQKYIQMMQELATRRRPSICPTRPPICSVPSAESRICSKPPSKQTCAEEVNLSTQIG